VERRSSREPRGISSCLLVLAMLTVSIVSGLVGGYLAARVRRAVDRGYQTDKPVSPVRSVRRRRWWSLPYDRAMTLASVVIAAATFAYMVDQTSSHNRGTAAWQQCCHS
jgi:hypothetical protein